ncbi:MAG: SpoIIE family protein phosphatase [Candidatus Cryptobacteroides sp.]
MKRNGDNLRPSHKPFLFNSFAGKLTFFIFLLMIMLFSVKMVFDFRYSSRRVLEMENKEFVNRLSGSLLVIRDSINNTELALAATLDKVYNNFNDDSHFPKATESLLEISGNTYGSAIALKHGSKGGNYMIYSYKTEDNEIRTSILPEYDYRSWDWYSDVEESLKPVWGDPYFDKSLSDKYLCTYSYPLFHSDGSFAGVFTADITLNDYERLLENLRPYEDRLCYTELIGKNGSYIASPRIPKDTIVDIRDYGKYTPEALDFIFSNDNGSQVSTVDGEECLIVHTLVDDSIGWRMIMACPMGVIMADMMIILILSFLGNLLFLMLLLIVIYVVVHNVLKPITTLSDSAQRIAGDLDTPVPTMKGVREIKRMRDSMESMRQSLRSYIEEVRQMTTESERIENELHIAREIQNSMLPPSHPTFNGHEGFRLRAYIRPAREVGGDLYDYILRDDKLFFLIGDSSGKGVPASMFMASTSYLYRALAMDNDSARDIVVKLNNALCRDNATNMFETMISGVLDLTEGTLELCNAGHTPPLSICSDKESYLSLSPNIPVGVMEDFSYTSNRFRIFDGDTVIFYTDGVTEAEDAEGKLFGKERLLATARSSEGDIIDDIVGAIGGFTDGVEQSDDITILALSLDKCLVHKELTLSNSIGEIDRIREAVESVSEECGIGKIGQKMMLAVEEAAANIISYGWPEGEQATFSFSLKVFRNHAEVVFKDRGKAFNPLEAPAPDTGEPLEDRQIGGLGIMLMRKLSDDAIYRRRCDGTNILSLKFINHGNNNQ